MKNKPISDITALEAMDAETFITLSKLFQRARTSYITADRNIQAVLQAVDDMCINLDTTIPESHNDISLRKAIDVYLHGGKISLNIILKNLKQWYGVEL